MYKIPQTFSFKSCFNGVHELLIPDGGTTTCFRLSFALAIEAAFSLAIELFVFAYAVDPKSIVLVAISNHKNEIYLKETQGICSKLLSKFEFELFCLH